MSRNGLLKALFKDAIELFNKHEVARGGDRDLAARAKVLLPELARKIPVLNEKLSTLAEERKSLHPGRRSGTSVNDPRLREQFAEMNRDFDKVVSERTAIREEEHGLKIIVEMCSKSPLWKSHSEMMKGLCDAS